jgi:hypothetical protein
VTSVRARACMHEVMFWILKRNNSDEDMDVPQQYGAWADKRRCSMTAIQSEWYQVARQSNELKWRDRNCREMPGAAGLQRVLEESLGTLVQALVCAMRARPAAACGRGALFVSSPSVPTRDWLVGVCTVNPGRHQTKRRATRATTLGLVPAGLIGDAPLVAARAKIMRPPGSSAKTHPSASLHACLVLRQMRCRGGRIGSSIPSGPLHRFAPLRPANIMRPKADIVRADAPYWHRLVRPAQSVGRCRVLVAPRRIRPRDLLAAQVRERGGDSHGLDQMSIVDGA